MKHFCINVFLAIHLLFGQVMAADSRPGDTTIKTPMIRSVVPTSAYWGDTVYFHGNHLPASTGLGGAG